MARKGGGMAAKLSYAGHLLMEHRNAPITDMELTAATGYTERGTAVALLRHCGSEPGGARSPARRATTPGLRRRLS